MSPTLSSYLALRDVSVNGRDLQAVAEQMVPNLVGLADEAARQQDVLSDIHFRSATDTSRRRIAGSVHPYGLTEDFSGQRVAFYFSELPEQKHEAVLQQYGLVGSSPVLRNVLRKIARFGPTEAAVVITGETGTGKELVAAALHEASTRHNQPFVALNCSAISAELLESELFGHEKGAFTGATRTHKGRFERADGGTLFLDEIGDMSAALQTRLLRVLAESEFYRVGGQTSIKVDVRVIAATNQDLAQAVRQGRFREDLYHRLNVIRIDTPPLRQRREDIPVLLRHYLADAAQELATAGKALNSEALEILTNYDWPGNVRQLVNAARRLTVTAPGNVITAADVPADLGGVTGKGPLWTEGLANWAEARLRAGELEPLLEEALPAFERTLIRIALARARGHRQEAAKLLGWGRNTLTRKIRALHLD
ncbi:MAG TPA: sigma 54-interacting transcriptional regulator [Woeseiaceae bacterium]|nr:sigma 54-interacting transcriptional regulator [Woeseiaceae bacterium]